MGALCSTKEESAARKHKAILDKEKEIPGITDWICYYEVMRKDAELRIAELTKSRMLSKGNAEEGQSTLKEKKPETIEDKVFTIKLKKEQKEIEYCDHRIDLLRERLSSIIKDIGSTIFE